MAVWESLALLVLIGAGALPWVLQRRALAPTAGNTSPSPSAFVAVLFIAPSLAVAAAVTVAMLAKPASDRHRQKIAAVVPQQKKDGPYVSSDRCQSCHPAAHASWHRSYHRTMTQLAVPGTVLAPFDGSTMQLDGREHTVYRRGQEYWVRTPDPDQDFTLRHNGKTPTTGASLPLKDRQVVMTTGSHSMQMYWTQSEEYVTELRLFPFVFQKRENRWIPYEDSFVVPPDAERPAVLWNDNCIACHSVNGRPRAEPQVLTAPEPNRYIRFRSEVAEFGIACEACHGPGDSHARFHQNPANRYRTHLQEESKTRTTPGGIDDPLKPGDKLTDTIINPAKQPVAVQNQICGQCHSSFHMRGDYFSNGENYRPGAMLADFRTPIRFSDGQSPDEAMHYWPDGTARIGGRELLGMLESPCTQAGELSCLSCHSMHNSDPNDQLAQGMNSSRACLQCHEQIGKDLSAHTHHAPESSGSQCYNCHMPHTSYALLGAIRSHRITSPSVQPVNPDENQNSRGTGSRQFRRMGNRPNACNLCHQDQTMHWTADKLKQWYDIDSKLPDDPKYKSVAAAPLWLFEGDAAQRTIVAWNLRRAEARRASSSAGEWQIPLLIELLDDPYAAVRFVAYHSLKSFDAMRDAKFDFIADPQHRRSVQADLLRIWQAHSTAASDSQRPAGPHLLLDRDGQLDRSLLAPRLRRRNQTPVRLYE